MRKAGFSLNWKHFLSSGFNSYNTTYRNILLTSCGFRHTVYFLLYAINLCMGSNSPQWSRNSGFSSSLSYLLNSNFYRWISALLAQVSIGHLTFKPTINHKPLRATKCAWKWNFFLAFWQNDNHFRSIFCIMK